jgi:hypothetical protein
VRDEGGGVEKVDMGLESEGRKKAIVEVQEKARQKEFWRGFTSGKKKMEESDGEDGSGEGREGRQMWNDIKKGSEGRSKSESEGHEALFYDPHSMANIEQCMLHRQACLVRYDDTESSARSQPSHGKNCICCGQGVHQGKIPVCLSKSDPSSKSLLRDNVGAGSCLYFELLKFYMLVTAVIIITLVIYQSIYYGTGTECQKNSAEHHTRKACGRRELYYYIAANRDFSKIDHVEKSLGVVTLLIIIFLNWIWIYRFEAQVQEWDDDDTTPQDYAVMLQDLPSSEGHTEVEKRFKKLMLDLKFKPPGGYLQPWDVQHPQVIPCYSIYDYTLLSRKNTAAVKMLDTLSKKLSINFMRCKEIECEIKQCQAEKLRKCSGEEISEQKVIANNETNLGSVYINTPQETPKNGNVTVNASRIDDSKVMKCQDKKIHDLERLYGKLGDQKKDIDTRMRTFEAQKDELTRKIDKLRHFAKEGRQKQENLFVKQTRQIIKKGTLAGQPQKKKRCCASCKPKLDYNHLKFTGTAIVVFESQNQRNKILEYYKPNWFQHL